MQDEEIRTPRGKELKFAVGYAAFTIFGVAMVVGGGIVTKVMGVIAILFFGGGGAVVLTRMLRDGGAALTLTPKGTGVAHGGLVPWQDIEAVGVGVVPGGPRGVRAVGLRIRDPRRYAASLSPGRVRAMRVGNLAGVPFGGSLPGGTPVDELAKTMEFSRRKCGWNLTVPQSMLPGSAEDVVRRIDDYARRLQG